ncbi:putative exonuclease [Xenohaliotis phage pCXc-HC2016]|nr:putative exonuclease [Xenohaliotis phage pCXc-HC2016]AQW89137.1 putative exonuclease [Xenohaliotis phage pCXc-HR2015]
MEKKIRVRSTVLRSILSYEPSGLGALLGVKTEPTALMKLGSMAHCYLLEEGCFNDYYAPYEGRKGGKSYQQAEETDLEPVKMEEAATAYKMSLAALEQLKKFPHINAVVNDKDAMKEFFIEFTDDKFHHTGTIDLYSAKFATLIDYKTTSYPVATKGLWSREADKRMYHLQMAYYKMLLEKKSYPVKEVYHVVQSMEQPYLVSVFSFSEESLEIGKKLFGSALVQVEHSLEEFSKIQKIYIEEEASSPYLLGFEDIV